MTQLPRTAAVVGGGTMGCGVAAALALGGIPVTVLVRRQDAVEETRTRVESRIAAHVALGLVDDGAAATAGNRVHVALDAGAGGYDIVVECVAEDAAAKREVLAALEPVLSESGLLTTCTSSLSVDELATGLSDPSRFLAWHWFHPGDLVRVVEVVGGTRTDPAAVETLRAWSLALGKAPVCLRRDIRGFVANRLQYALVREAYALVEAGVCSPEDVDVAVTDGIGARWSAVGPFTAADLAGLDVHGAVAALLFPELDCSTTVPTLLTETQASGALGVKNGRGLRGTYTPEQTEALLLRRDTALAGVQTGRTVEGQPLTPDECAARARETAATIDLDTLDRSGPGTAVLLWRDEESEGWLNLWWEPRDTGYHDHDGSAVGVHVLEGRAWNEPFLIDGPRRALEYGPGDSFSFPGDGIHRMEHEPGAVTIHVYSPPLRALGHYEVQDGRLHRRPAAPDEPTPPSPGLVSSLGA